MQKTKRDDKNTCIDTHTERERYMLYPSAKTANEWTEKKSECEKEAAAATTTNKKSNAKEANYKHTETKELNYKTSSVQKNIETWKNPNGNVITATPNSQALWFVLLLSLQLLPLFFAFSFHRTYLLKHTELLPSFPWISSKRENVWREFFVFAFFFSLHLISFLSSTFPFLLDS